MGPVIQKKDTVMHQCGTPEERILITLRYLATGCTFTSLLFYFARGECTISRAIEETTQFIWDTLKETNMHVPSKEEWKNIASRYSPKLLGGYRQETRIQKFPNSGSINFNYNGYHCYVIGLL
ncbi:hypothetical protein J437_LFUL013596 [Ladona fulva]|uniref:Uncharacterized protein n=1 Tax=Ladona fulva TaxID=123851 RepID=A0A8K0KFG1_LADFU|nr:hypothetical protein J437_LFUL013596 [Ladona fulva]